MTQEEKARAYDEALERARQIKNGENGWGYSDLVEITPALEEVFPQLREGEDEKIMKAVVKSAEEWYKDNYGYDNPQGKAVVIDAYVAGAIDWLKKQKEQKPISFNEPYNPDEYEVVMEGNATSLKRKEQKSAEWSEEDEKMVEKIDCYLSSAIGVSEEEKQNIQKWLKSFRLQPKQEWSEEDDATIKSAVHWLEKYLSTIRAKDVSSATQDGILTVKVTITNLKSLHPNIKK